MTFPTADDFRRASARALREWGGFARYLARAEAHRDWTLAGARAAARLLASQRKDLYALLPIHAANKPDKQAIVGPDRAYTYGELDAAANGFAAGLSSLGVKRKDKVIVALGNTAESVVVSAGAANAGAVVVPVSTHYKARELEHVVLHSDARLVCLTTEQWQAIGGSAAHTPEYLRGRTLALLGERREWPAGARAVTDIRGVVPPPLPLWRQLLARDHDARLMLYTSGTTGKAKGAMLGMHRVSNLRAFELLGTCGFTKHDRFYTACPAYHAAPTAFIGFVLSIGGTVILGDHFDAARVWHELDAQAITCAFMVPTQIVRLLALGPETLAKKPRALARLLSGGAALPLPVKQRALAEIGPILYDFYGATELGLVSLATPEDLRRKPGTIGKPFPGVRVKLMQDGREVAHGERGELYVTSDQLDFGYYKNDAATQQASLGAYRTVGDIAVEDADGFLFLVDRKVDLIISGGVNIYPAEIENELLTHPRIADAAVVGVPDAEWGESVCAFVVARGELTSAEVIAFCAERLASLKKPKRVEFLSEIPRSPQGKIQKRELRARLAVKETAV
jgi:acyl-CoA synthetase (AMP-forming)/AMP-acid ligase II